MRVLLIVTGAVVLILGVIVAGWFWNYNANLHPRLVLELPVSECSDLSFGSRYTYGFGWAVDELCEKNGVLLDRPVFALQGRRAVRFVPRQFHAVKGKLEVEVADENTVYFYSYHKRYIPIIMEP